MGRCPNCGSQLVPTFSPQSIAQYIRNKNEAMLDVIANTPPVKCESCSRGWWPSELTPEARRAWNPQTRSFGSDQTLIFLRSTRDRDNRQAEIAEMRRGRNQ